MGKTGSIDKLSVLAVVDWNNRQKIEQSKAFETYSKGLDSTLATFKEIGKSKDLDLIIRAEEMMVLQERELYGQQDSSVLPSLNAAVADFDVIKQSVETVKSPGAYQNAASTYHAKKKTQGVVADGCHEAINGHVTRLGNRMSAVGVSVPEKNILRQRQANMRVTKELYVNLQRKALGLESPAKDKGLKR